MELRSKTQYSNRFFTLYPGEETTHRPDITEEQKQYLISAFPADFEVIKENEKPKVITNEFKLTIPESKLKISGLEDNLKIQTKQVGRPKKAK